MDSGNVAAIIAAAGAIAAAAIAAWVTRQGAKESQKRTDQLTAAGLYTQLAADQRTDLTAARMDIVELRRRVTSLEGVLVNMRSRVRVHMRWDDQLVAQVNKVPGVHVPPAPPLLEEDE
jgi:hypothetical protein